MGRRSLAKERTEQILEAYAICIARYGLQGATLEKVSEESGFSRGHIRHYVGNRDEMRSKVIDWVISDFEKKAEEWVLSFPLGERARARMRHMFEQGVGPAPDNAAIDVLLGAATYDAELRGMLRDAYLGVESTIAGYLREDFPGATAKVYRDAAYQILAIAFGNWSLSELEFPASRQSSAVAIGEFIIEQVRDAAERARAERAS